MSIRLFENKHPAGHVEAKHAHDYYQLLYTLDQSGEIAFDDEQYSFEDGSIVFLPPQTFHEVHSKKMTTILVLEFEAHHLNHTIAKLLGNERFDKAFILPLQKPEKGTVQNIWRRLLNETSSTDWLSEVAIEIGLAELLLGLVRWGEPDEKKRGDLSQQIKQYIEHNYYSINRLDDLISVFNYTGRYLTQIYKVAFHQTPMQAVQDKRIEKAIELLTTTDLEIISICFQVGYESLATFYRQFKMKTGQSPKKFRN
ncbi:helix-turn-helix domain-containing protein [Jeotgalibaca sp. A122]|uniref:helix-turn-helix domain-containing protein n=1 Tax=Jeotgalibaca sp. A122 TaxID=3457322 RepID=UPI003FCEF291